MIMNWDVAL